MVSFKLIFKESLLCLYKRLISMYIINQCINTFSDSSDNSASSSSSSQYSSASEIPEIKELTLLDSVSAWKRSVSSISLHSFSKQFSSKSQVSLFASSIRRKFSKHQSKYSMKNVSGKKIY